MSELYLEPTQVYSEDPLGITDTQHDDFVVAFETVNVIYHGLITTPHRDYQKPHIQEALRARVGELAAITNYSAESVYLAIDNIATGTYSTENEFFAMVKSVIEKIIFDETGKLSTWPPGFFDQSRKNKAKLLG